MDRGITRLDRFRRGRTSDKAARLRRFALHGLIVAFLTVAVVQVLVIWIPAMGNGEAPLGYDLNIYVERTRSWLDGEGFYRARQLAGSYVIENGDALYPPPFVLLMLPWAIGAPAVLWWLLPTVVAAAALYRLRPPLWAWALLALVLVYRRTLVAIVLGNPSIWVFAAILAGAAYGWPALGALIKPALAPFALIGARRRSWWIGLGVVSIVAVAFAPMWPDYLRVLLDARNGRDVWYVVGEVPIGIALTIVGWAGVRARAAVAAEPSPAPLGLGRTSTANDGVS